ncbi:MAG TPA: hypothetical protein VN456_00335 [Desulfosporosinus sp.]|nr:hypothetical protein [Desulfosporosinus sp.]
MQGHFSSARSGYAGVRSGYYDEWFQSLQTGLQRMKEAGIKARNMKMTELEKLVFARDSYHKLYSKKISL